MNYFSEKPLEWNATGVEPSDALKNSGYKPKDNPAAENENYFRNRTYKAIDEIQNKSAGLSVEGYKFTIDGEAHTAGEGCEIFNSYRDQSAGGNIAVSEWSHAEGYTTVAMAFAAHSEGQETRASGWCAHAQNAETTASAYASHAGGSGTVADGDCGFAHGSEVTAHAYNFVIGKRAKAPTAATLTDNTGDLFVIGSGLEGGAKSNALRVTAKGEVMGTQAYSATGADFAEAFEWLDGNPENEDRRGLFVTLDGEKIRPATAEDEYILGVVSAAPTIVGDACTDDWQGKYVTDEYGARVFENGAWKLAEDFDEELDESYTSRLERPEWGIVGLVGKLIVRCDDTVKVNGYCRAGANGIATDSFAGYRVMSVNNGYARILLK